MLNNLIPHAIQRLQIQIDPFIGDGDCQICVRKGHRATGDHYLCRKCDMLLCTPCFVDSHQEIFQNVLRDDRRSAILGVCGSSGGRASRGTRDRERGERRDRPERGGRERDVLALDGNVPLRRPRKNRPPKDSAPYVTSSSTASRCFGSCPAALSVQSDGTIRCTGGGGGGQALGSGLGSRTATFRGAHSAHSGGRVQRGGRAVQRKDGRHTLPSGNRASEYALCSSLALASCAENSSSHEQLAVTAPLAVDTQRHNCALSLPKMPPDASIPLCIGAAASSVADPNVVYGCFQFDANATTARASEFCLLLVRCR